MTRRKPRIDADSTVRLGPVDAQPAKAPNPIKVIRPAAGGAPQAEEFAGAFRVGRSPECAICVPEDGVSRQHLEVYPEDGHWWVRDLRSLNGTYLEGKPITQMRLEGTTTLELGRNGPVIHLLAPAPPSLDDIAQHYFDPTSTAPAGERTILIRKAFREVQQETRRKHSRQFRITIGTALALLLAIGGFALYQHIQLQNASRLAIDIFYNMKALELQIANLEGDLSTAELATRHEEIAARQRELSALRRRYEEFVSKIQLARLIPLDSEERVILHVARTFGETEVDVPDGFTTEVKAYIDKWRSTPRLSKAIGRLHEKDLTKTIYEAMTEHGLPPQFLYLALQESDFRPERVGPPTRYGHAKGMWQFIPATGMRYGLRPGPLQGEPEFDPQDERHDFEKSTRAAAAYLKDIYRTDAQASGLLVMASYNWGEGNIIRLIRQMPENPRERNFWELLRRYEIPKETYDYVFYIFSAAVIGENPQLFGFDFENPLEGLDAASTI